MSDYVTAQANTFIHTSAFVTVMQFMAAWYRGSIMMNQILSVKHH